MKGWHLADQLDALENVLELQDSFAVVWSTLSQGTPSRGKLRGEICNLYTHMHIICILFLRGALFLMQAEYTSPGG